MLVLWSCDQSFDGRGPLDHKIVVFSILSTDRDLQFVRVEQSYMPDQYDPISYTGDTYLSGTRVSIRLGSKTWTLRDTLLPRPDTLRYKYPIHAFVANFRGSKGSKYYLDVSHPVLGKISSSVTVPWKPTIELAYPSGNMLGSPTSYSDSGNIVFKFTTVIAFVGRMFVDYEVLDGGEWKLGRVEIPESYKSSELHDLAYVNYPKLTKTPSYIANGTFKNDLYQRVLRDVAFNKYRLTPIIFDRVVYQVLQVDSCIYRYINPDEDPNSIRLDERVFLNINGGVGLFGAYSVDSLVFLLPETFPFNH